jgi:hypothetical protein
MVPNTRRRQSSQSTNRQYDQSLAQLHERAANATGRPSTSDDRSTKIEELWAEINSGLDVTIPENFGPFLSRYLSRRAREVDNNERRARLCGCGNPMCNVLSGEMPARLQQPGGRFRQEPVTPERGREFVRMHSGCHAVQDALEAFDEARSEVRQNLIKIIRLGNSTANAPEIDEENIPT